MAEVVEMIQLSPTMEEGVLAQWNAKEGDTVSAGDVIAEVETDKATMDMESFFDGVVLKILVSAGDAVPIGAAMAIVGEAGEDISALLAEIEAGGGAAGGGAPEGGSGDGGGSAGGAADAAGDAETDSLPAVGAAEPGEPTSPQAASAGGRVLASPMARRIAAEKGVDLSQVHGSGPQGRVVKRDVESFVPSAAVTASVTAVSSKSTAAAFVPSYGGARAEDRIEPLSQMRKAIAKNLQTAWQAPAFMLTRDIAMDAVMANRKALNTALAEDDAGIKVSVNDFIIKAAARALMDVPAMNSAYEGDNIRLYGSADIGMAVALDGGLITPIVRNAESKTLTHIAAEAKSLALRARDRKLKPDEFTGATFSISNLGMFGIDHFTAVLNPPAAGILAVGATRKTPVVNDAGELAVGLRMSVTLTCDHRAVDGAVGAQFLIRFARYMESPTLMLA